MLYWTNRSTVVSLAAMSVALVAAPAWAQDEETQTANTRASHSELGEILVTARKTGEAAQSLPISVAAFTSEELENKVVKSAQDLQAITPGLTVSNRATGGVPVFAIRGTATELGVDGGVAIYYNDVPLISTIGIMNSFYDVSTIEILKGPQGTQFGTNTTGGTISVRTNLPTDRFEGYALAGIGNFDRREFEAMINIPVNDVAGFRFAGNYVKRDGYSKNLAAGSGNPKTYQDENHYSFRGTFAIDTGPLQNYLIADYYNRDEAPFAQTPVKFAPSGYGVLLPDLFPSARLGTYNTLYQGENPSGVQAERFGKADLYGIQNRTNFELSDNFSLRNVIGFRHDHTTTSEDNSGVSPIVVDVWRDDKVSQWTNDLTLRYENKDIGLRASIGGYYSFLRQETGLTANVLQGLYAYFGLPADPNAVISTNNFEVRELRSRAVYVNADYDVTDTINVQGGFRYNWDSANSVVTAGSNLANPATPFGTLPIFGGPFTPTPDRPCDASRLIGYDNFNPAACVASREVSFRSPSWMFGVTNKFSDRVMGYAKISHGYLAGGTNFTLRDVGYTTYKPEKNTMMEIGMKADWRLADRPIRTNIALYRAKITGKQVYTNANYNDPAGSTGFGVINAAKQSVYGLDLEVRYSPVENLTLDVGYNYVKAKFDEFVFPGLGGDANGQPNGQAGDAFVPAFVLSGATPAQTPKHQLNLAATYDWPLNSELGEISTTISGYYTSQITQANRLSDFDRAAGGELNIIDGYFLLNGSLNWDKVMGSPVSVRFWARNILNKHYATASQIQFQTFGYGAQTFGAPQTFGATVKVDF
ncbi:TonB-dependent receptor [Sphingopyxis flava]|uniref:Outer membrane receptor proteins, mostly Fe transport n=1 Tax=Sphingopyxis flava TaxID=1507287 RepID=A0A1T5FLL0_9SPHN|nr:TonB-dependent receptor [Sphingopyxis flava]SKB97059.1 Outer membrane receptor proteins, mostly Fe transport [Sphingopyxis flava]